MNNRYIIFCDRCKESEIKDINKTRLEQSARAQGWKSIKRKWVCPTCQTELEKLRAKNTSYEFSKAVFARHLNKDLEHKVKNYGNWLYEKDRKQFDAKYLVWLKEKIQA